MTLRTYDPKEVSVIFGAPIKGFADGTFVSVEYNEDFFTMQIGADGDAIRAKSNNSSARVTITLLQSSESNDILSATLNLDRLSPSGDGILPFLLKDNTGRTLMTAEKMWITKPPTVAYGREGETREWVLETDNMLPSNIGGNL